jgi:hypothetical protein
MRPTHSNKPSLARWLSALLLLSCTAMSIHATDEAGKFAPVVADKNLKQDVEVAPLTPDFTSVVVKGGGLWPQLHCAPDGTLLALGYNAPGHTTLPGDVDCWASADGGKTWEKRGTAAPRPHKDANYCDSCSGFAANGDLMLLSGGFEDAGNARGKRKPVMPLGVFRSADLGRTWKKEGNFPRELRAGVEWRPYGTVVPAPDKTLRTVVYAYRGTEGFGGYMMTSRDDGRTWVEPVPIAEKINEGVLLPLAGKSWLCVARTTEKPAPELGQELRQFRSTDDGKTWTDEGLLAGFHKHPPSLIRLKDNRLVLTYGNRRNGNVEARLSKDDGKKWDAPLRLFQASGDMGYPSTVQLSDGRLVTVFYAKQSSLHDGYHMGAIGWQPPEANN